MAQELEHTRGLPLSARTRSTPSRRLAYYGESCSVPRRRAQGTSVPRASCARPTSPPGGFQFAPCCRATSTRARRARPRPRTTASTATARWRVSSGRRRAARALHALQDHGDRAKAAAQTRRQRAVPHVRGPAQGRGGRQRSTAPAQVAALGGRRLRTAAAPGHLRRRHALPARPARRAQGRRARHLQRRSAGASATPPPTASPTACGSCATTRRARVLAVLVEVDEHSHTDRDPTCESGKIDDTFQALQDKLAKEGAARGVVARHDAHMVPIVFISVNPNAYDEARQARERVPGRRRARQPYRTLTRGEREACRRTRPSCTCSTTTRRRVQPTSRTLRPRRPPPAGRTRCTRRRQQVAKTKAETKKTLHDAAAPHVKPGAAAGAGGTGGGSSGGGSSGGGKTPAAKK